MTFFEAALYEVAYYRFWWLLFIGLIYCGARYGGWPGALVGPLVVAAIVLCLDVNWIFGEMRHHPEDGRDADGVFLFGVFVRIIFFNGLLAPLGIVGLVLRHRSRSAVELSGGATTNV